MVLNATSSSTVVDVSDALSTGALVAIMICAVFVLSFIVCVTYFFRMYFFYRLPIVSRPKTLFTNADAGCCTSMCVSINVPIISCCCPSLRDNIENSFLFDHSAQEITVVNRNVGGYQPVLHYNPLYHGHPSMRLNYENQMLLPVDNTGYHPISINQ
jgi:hypothetical protein